MSPKHYRIHNLPDSDPYWVTASKPLIGYVRDKPRTSEDVFQWMRDHGTSNGEITQILAWCENRKLISHRSGYWMFGYFKSSLGQT